MKGRSMAVGSTAILTTPTWAFKGLGGLTAPQGCSTARAMQSIQHPALLSLVCHCHCHFPLFEREGGIYFILLDLTEPLEGREVYAGGERERSWHGCC